MSSLKIISSIKNKKQKKKIRQIVWRMKKKIKKTKTISLVSSFIVLCLPLKKKRKNFSSPYIYLKEISEEIFCKIMKKNKSSVLVPSISVDKQKKTTTFSRGKIIKKLWPGKIPKTKYSASCKKTIPILFGKIKSPTQELYCN